MSYAWSQLLLRKDPRPPPSCGICRNPVSLETAKTDEYGLAVHQKCYFLKIKLPAVATGAMARPTSKVVQLPSFLGHYTI
jgi:hypothetical protein